MSGNESELPDEGDSSRLRDRASGALDRARGESTRLRDRASGAFQRRKQQAEQAREAVAEQRDRFADALGVDGDLVDAVQLDDRGEQIGFVPNDEGRDTLATEFAEDRPFVDPADALVEADPRQGVETITDPSARGDIAAEARTEAASNAQFIEPDDLAADVGPAGVEGVQTAPERRDQIEQRAEQALAADDPFAEPGDFDAEVGASGVASAGLTGPGERRRAGRQFEAETSLDSVDPATDLRETGDGFGLTRDPAREVAAARIDERTPNLDVGPGDIELEDTGGGFEAVFEDEVRR